MTDNFLKAQKKKKENKMNKYKKNKISGFKLNNHVRTCFV